MTFRFGAPITMDNATVSLAAGVAALDGGETEVALDSIAHSDSSALAVLIALRRHAALGGRDLRLLAMPEGVASLARLYGVEEIVAG